MSRILNQPALAIGGIGGSGTRAIAATLQDLGCDIGFDLNDALDDLTYTALLKDEALWPFNPSDDVFTDRLAVFIKARQKMNAGERMAIAEAFRCALPKPHEDHAWQSSDALSDRLWAVNAARPNSQRLLVWKEPNTHLALPGLLEAMPQLRYLHVVRHGLDMAWSSNQNQLTLWGSRVLDREINPGSAQDSFDYWCACHRRLLALQRRWPDRIQHINLDTLADNVTQGAAQLAVALEGNDLGIARPAIEAALARQVHKPGGLGRHLTHAKLEVTADQRELLTKLGY